MNASRWFQFLGQVKNGIDDRRLADAGPADHDQYLGHQCETERGYLAFRKGKPDTLLEPIQGRGSAQRASAAGNLIGI